MDYAATSRDFSFPRYFKELMIQVFARDPSDRARDRVEDRDDLQAAEEHPQDANRKQNLICPHRIRHLIRQGAE